MTEAETEVQAEHFEDRRKRFKFLNWELLIAIAMLLSGGLFGFTNLKSDVRDLGTHITVNEERVKSLEDARHEDHDLLLRLDENVKVIRQKMETPRP